MDRREKLNPAAVERMRQLWFDDWKAQVNQATDWPFPEYAAGFNHVPKYAAIIPQRSHRTPISEELLRRYRSWQFQRSAVGR